MARTAKKATITPTHCKARALESKKLSRCAGTGAAKVMLKHIAETWKRVGREVEATPG